MLPCPQGTPSPRSGGPHELRLAAWQLGAFSQRKLGVHLTAHSFRLSIQAPRRETPPSYLHLTDLLGSPHSSLSSLHTLLLTATSMGKGTVVLPQLFKGNLSQPPLACRLQTRWPIPILRPRPHCLGHPVSLAPHLLLLRDTFLVLMCWYLCKGTVPSVTIPLNFICKLCFPHLDEISGKSYSVSTHSQITERPLFFGTKSPVQSANQATPAQRGLKTQTLPQICIWFRACPAAGMMECGKPGSRGRGCLSHYVLAPPPLLLLNLRSSQGWMQRLTTEGARL